MFWTISLVPLSSLPTFGASPESGSRFVNTKRWSSSCSVGAGQQQKEINLKTFVFLKDLISGRSSTDDVWCHSCCFRSEEIPENILQATANLKTVNIIPAIGKWRWSDRLSAWWCHTFIKVEFMTAHMGHLTSDTLESHLKVWTSGTIFLKAVLHTHTHTPVWSHFDCSCCFRLLSIRSERSQPSETWRCRPHAGNHQVSGRQAAVARPALHASVPL